MPGKLQPPGGMNIARVCRRAASSVPWGGGKSIPGPSMSILHPCHLTVEWPVLPGASQYQEMARGFQWDFVPSRYNIAFSACDRHAQKRPHHPAIIHLSAPHATPEILTFHELHSQSNRLAHALRHTAQLTRGDRVGIILPQRPETAVSHMAVYRSGGVTVPLFNLFGPDALRYRLATSEAKIVVTDAMGYEKIEGILDELPCLQGVVIVGGEQDSQAPLPSGCLNYHKLIEESRPPGVILEDTHGEDPATLIFTSGTTGDPKGALHAHRVLLGHLPGVEFPNNLFPEGICKGKNLRFYTPADWAWIGGLFDVLLPSLHYGVSVLSHRATKFDPLEMADMMARHQVTNTFLPPTALKLMRRANLPAASHLLSIGSGGESLGTQLLEWGRETYGTTINEFYGQTEANLLIGNCSVLHEVKEGSMGLPIPGRQVDIVDEAGHVLPAGEVGQIAVRKGDPVMFLGYWNNPEATQDKFVNGWMVTGDVGKKDEDGFFYFHGRQDDVINSAGYRIGPSEVEDCVIKHPDVVMCAAIGAPDPIRNEVVKCFCVLRDGCSGTPELARSIQQFVKTRLAAHEYPREIEFVSSLPMTTTGKIQRRILKQQEYEKRNSSPSTPL